MNLRIPSMLASLALIGAALPAVAADNGFYVGGGVNQSTFDSSPAQPVDFEDSSYKFVAGFRPLDWLAVEANYDDYGSDSFTTNVNANWGFKASGISLSALGIYEIGPVDLFARAGAVRWKYSQLLFNGNQSDVYRSNEGTDPLFGVGVGVHFGSFGARLEYEDFRLGDFGDHMRSVSLAATYTFL